MVSNGYTSEMFSAIFKKYWRKLYSICYKYTLNQDAAKDMVQNIFVTFWQKKDIFEDVESLEKYLTKAAKYQVFNYIRNSKKLNHLSDESIVNIEDVSQTPYQIAVYNQLSCIYEQQVAMLNEPAKTIYRLSRINALTHKEIAEKMGIAVKTVEYHLTKAKKNILENFKRD